MANNKQSKSAEYQVNTSTALFIQRYCGRTLDLLDIVEIDCYLQSVHDNGEVNAINDAQWAAHDLIVSNDSLRKKITASLKADELSDEFRTKVRASLGIKSTTDRCFTGIG